MELATKNPNVMEINGDYQVSVKLAISLDALGNAKTFYEFCKNSAQNGVQINAHYVRAEPYDCKSGLFGDDMMQTEGQTEKLPTLPKGNKVLIIVKGNNIISKNTATSIESFLTGKLDIQSKTQAN